MSYKICIYDPVTLRRHQFWNNYVHQHVFTTMDFDVELGSWGARNIPNSPYIEFDSEEQATYFVLMWS